MNSIISHAVAGVAGFTLGYLSRPYLEGHVEKTTSKVKAKAKGASEKARTALSRTKEAPEVVVVTPTSPTTTQELKALYARRKENLAEIEALNAEIMQAEQDRAAEDAARLQEERARG